MLQQSRRTQHGQFQSTLQQREEPLALRTYRTADFDKAVSLKPEHAKAHELFGDALSRSGKEEEAAIHWAIAETLREKRKGR
mgnify:CR=1 FL=1